MQEEQEAVISLDKSSIITKVFYASIFIGLAISAPYFLNQLITGSIVNALLFISASVLGLEAAFLLCMIPSLVSIYTGLLPMALLPMIPFIMIGNALLVFTFSKLANPSARLSASNFWKGAISAAFVKFIFIWSAGMVLASFILKGAVVKNVMLMISWPQFATAISGAAIAYLFLKAIKKI
jgi:hypothetical protein